MERERLTRLLEEPGRMAREDLVALKAMASKYPWFTGAQLLHAAGERLSGNVLSDETLRTAAAHIPSRTVLFGLAHKPETRVTALLRVVRPETEAPTTEPAPTNLVAEVPASTANEIAEQAEALPSGPSPMAEARAAEPLEVAPAEATDTQATDELDAQIMLSAMAGAYDLTWSEDRLEARKQPDLIIPAPIAPPATPAAKPARRAVDPTARLRFTDWLEVSSGDPAPSSSVAQAPVPEKGSTASTSAPANPLDATTLIDRFIQQDPPAIQQKAVFFTPQQAGKRSLDDTAGLVTETLARIYEKQGNLAKAIDTYARLALKYPEKAAYFAALQKSLADRPNP